MDNQLVKKQAPQPGTAPLVHEAVINVIERYKYKGTILDAGAGKGTLSSRLKDKGYTVRACDVDAKWFEADGIEFTQTDLNQQLPYEDNSFDFVCCVETIEHLWNPWGLVQEFYRILNDGGKLIITTPNISSIFSRLRFLLSGRFLSFGKKNFDILGHISPVTDWQLRGMLSKTGFQNITIGVNAGWIPIIEIQLPVKHILTGNCIVAVCQK
ncbi:MAG: class I SAM-dependent methyltransferase [Nitrospiraceae bacterium]|nr:MAG: class I SAM-dependent methyltransferase [Nitrospiraceae bacterium]